MKIKGLLKSKQLKAMSALALILVAAAPITTNCWLLLLGQPKVPKHLIKQD